MENPTPGSLWRLEGNDNGIYYFIVSWKEPAEGQMWCRATILTVEGLYEDVGWMLNQWHDSFVRVM